MQNVSSNVNYEAIEEQRFQELQRSITQRLSQTNELGHGDSLRHVILSRVVHTDYEGARRELNQFVKDKSDFPVFQLRTERMRRYCVDLINAIETKRNFHGLGSLPLAKQQELYEKVIVHFDELTAHLKVIERQEKEAKLDDIRSTVWVLRALSGGVFFVVSAGVLLEMHQGLAESAKIVYDSFAANMAEHLFKMLGW